MGWIAVKVLLRPTRSLVAKADAPNLSRLKFVPVRAGLSADEQELAQAVLEAIGRLQVSASGNDVLVAVMGQDWKAVVDRLAWEGWSQKLGVVKQLLDEHYAAAAASTLIAVDPGLAILTAHPMPFAARAAQRAGESITGITERTREAISAVIEDAVNQGWSMPRIAMELKHFVGLTEDQASALFKYADGLRTAGRSESQINSLVAQMRDRMGATRAKTIARYETQTAMNEGRQAAWNQAALHGAIGHDATKQWVAGDDPCPDCDEVDGEEVGLNESFSNGEDQPPAHPNCRCSSIISDAGTVNPTHPEEG